MTKIVAITLVMASLLPPLPVWADAWTQGQAQWAAHGFKHGRWDCNGKCPQGRHVATAKRSKR